MTGEPTKIQGLELTQAQDVHHSSSAGTSEISLDHSLVPVRPNMSPTSQIHQQIVPETRVQLFSDTDRPVESRENISACTRFSPQEQAPATLNSLPSPVAAISDASRLLGKDPSVHQQPSLAASGNWPGLHTPQAIRIMEATSAENAQGTSAMVATNDQKAGDAVQPAMCLNSSASRVGCDVADGHSQDAAKTGELGESDVDSTHSKFPEVVCTPGKEIVHTLREQQTFNPDNGSSSPHTPKALVRLSIEYLPVTSLMDPMGCILQFQGLCLSSRMTGHRKVVKIGWMRGAFRLANQLLLMCSAPL